jgi:hypothetical protein
VLVDVGHVDVACAELVRHVRDRTHERRVLDQSDYEDVLPLGDVGADLDGKLCHCVNAAVLHAKTLPIGVMGE